MLIAAPARVAKGEAMKRALLSLMVALLALPVMAGGPKDKDKEIRKSQRRIPGQYIVVFEDRIEDVESAAADLVANHRGRGRHVFKSALKGFAAELSEQAAARIAEDPR